MTQYLKRPISIFIAALILVQAACASLPIHVSTLEPAAAPTNTAGIPVTGGELVNTQWVLDSFNEGGTELPSISTVLPYLEFRENGEAGGSGGCNTFSTQYEVQNGEISFGPIASTKIACPIDIMQKEQMFFDAFGTANRYEVSGDTLRIWYANVQKVLAFTRMARIAPTTVPPTTAAPAATSTTVGNTNAEQRIRFATGATSTTVSGTLAASESDRYVLRALAGQTLSLNLTFTVGQAILVVWGDDGDVLLSDHTEVSSFERELTKTQDYHMMVRGKPEGNTAYNLVVNIPAISTGVKRIEFARGSTSASVSGQLSASASDQYLLRAQAGQTLSINTTFAEGAAILVVWGADGNVLLSDHAEVSIFQGVLPATQDYYILVKGRPDGATSYTMTIDIPPSS